MKRIIISGASSFIGNALIERLLNENCYIYAAVRPGSDGKISHINSQKIGLIEIDMMNYNSLDVHIDCKCDIFISLAWSGTNKEDRNNEEIQRNNYIYSLDALKASIRCGCKKIIIAGSQAEYGSHSKIISERTDSIPNTPYGRWKLHFYNKALELCSEHNVSLKEIRFFSVYGPNDHPYTLISSLTRNMLLNQPCYLTEGTQLWNYLYVADAADGIVELMKSDCEDGVYNMASSDTRPLKSFIEEIKKATGSESRLIYGAVPYTNENRIGINPCIDKIYSRTGWKPAISFSEGIKKTIDFIGSEG